MPTRKELLQTKIDTDLATGTSITATEHRGVESAIMNASLPVNRGFFTGLDIGGTTGSLTVGGDITSAIATVSSGSYITVTFATSMIDTNYFIRTSLQSMGTTTIDDLAFCPVFKVLTATTAEIWIRESTGGAQNLRFHLEAISLNY